MPDRSMNPTSRNLPASDLVRASVTRHGVSPTHSVPMYYHIGRTASSGQISRTLQSETGTRRSSSTEYLPCSMRFVTGTTSVFRLTLEQAALDELQI